MTKTPRWLTRLRLRLWRRTEDDRDLDDEIRFHLSEETRLRIDRGAPPADAWASTRRDFGNVQRVKEITRAMRTTTAVETVVQDLRYGVRLLSRSRLFAFFAITSLALGIGATTAMFSLFNAVVLRPLPVKEPERLIALAFAMPGRPANNNMPYPHFDAMRRGNRTLEGLFAWSSIPRINLEAHGRGDIVSGIYASGAFHSTLGLVPAMGRLLTEEDDRGGGATSIVISYAYWQRRFGGDSSVVGMGITLNRVPFTIVGVEPRGFAGPNVGTMPDITLPLHALERLSDSGNRWSDPFATWIEIMGRLRQDATIESAKLDLEQSFRQVNAEAARGAASDSIAGRVAREATLHVHYSARGGFSGLRRNYERWLRLMLAMLASVVLLASLNLATLMLSRTEVRRHEIATRIAIGAGRSRLVRQLLTESMLVALTGGALGIPLAWWLGGTLLRVATSRVDLPPVAIAPDVRVLTFALGVSTLTCVLFGLAPALRATAGLHSPSREIGTPRRRKLERILVTAQTAVSLVLLVLATLFARSLQNLWALDPGYDRSNVLMFSIDAALAGKRGPDVPATYRAVLDELERLPAVERASISAVRPVSDTYYFISVVTAIGEQSFTDSNAIRVAYNNLGPGYFATLRVPLVAGRDFDRRDVLRAPKVVIVSERLAQRFSGPAVGQSIRMGPTDIREVIGVARDHRYANIKDAPRDVVYQPIFQSDGKGMWFSPTFELRYRGSVADATREARDAIARVDPALTMFGIKTLDAQTRDSLVRERLLAILSTYFGGFALLLACIGLYGLMTYGVTQRTPELGLRLALGAPPSRIRWLIIADGSTTVLAGAIVGLVAAFPLVRLVETQLYDVRPHDPAAIGIAVATLLAVALGASYLPARRAARIDPLVALRHE
jgi:predicted permease